MTAYIITGLFVFLLIFIQTRPGTFAVSRSARISASPDNIFPHVNDFRNWEAWSPWAKIDPQAKMTFEGPEAGTGAIMRWAGNNKVGEGSMTIVQSTPNASVAYRLDFLKPMKGTSEATFAFAQQGNETVVTWSMTGKNNFLAKAFSLFVNCEKMIGGNFEQGLENLKNVTEK